jgi:hypothetical protein
MRGTNWTPSIIPNDDISADVAAELRRRGDLQMRELPATISDFVERHEKRDKRQLTFRLV